MCTLPPGEVPHSGSPAERRSRGSRSARLPGPDEDHGAFGSSCWRSSGTQRAPLTRVWPSKLRWVSIRVTRRDARRRKPARPPRPPSVRPSAGYDPGVAVSRENRSSGAGQLALTGETPGPRPGRTASFRPSPPGTRTRHRRDGSRAGRCPSRCARGYRIPCPRTGERPEHAAQPGGRKCSRRRQSCAPIAGKRAR